MVNVRTGRLLCACISATIVDESIPPERKAPSGTSATISPRRPRPLSSASNSSATASADRRGFRIPVLGDCRADPSSSARAGPATRPPATVRIVAGGQLESAAIDRVRRRDVAVPQEERDASRSISPRRRRDAPAAPSAPSRTAARRPSGRSTAASRRAGRGPGAASARARSQRAKANMPMSAPQRGSSPQRAIASTQHLGVGVAAEACRPRGLELRAQRRRSCRSRRCTR